MPCHGCARNFNLLNREYGCSGCGFAFCSKCLRNKICKKCASKSDEVPPAIIQSELEKLENPNKPPITVYVDSSDSRLGNLKRGLSVEDQELVDRLQKLKSEVRQMKVAPPSQDEIEDRLQKLKNDIKEMKQIPSQDEIEQRLARLKGIDPEVYKKPHVFVQPKSNIDSASALFNQTVEELAIEGHTIPTKKSSDSNDEAATKDDIEALLRQEIEAARKDARKAVEELEKDEEIKKKLSELRIAQKKPANDQESEEEDDDEEEEEEEEATMIVEKALAEKDLELMDAEDVEAGERDRLPWCELCNEDAQLSCSGCDGELFCQRCWKETHRDEVELRNHKTEKFSAS